MKRIINLTNQFEWAIFTKTNSLFHCFVWHRFPTFNRAWWCMQVVRRMYKKYALWRFWVPTTYVFFMETWRKLSQNYHQILLLHKSSVYALFLDKNALYHLSFANCTIIILPLRRLGTVDRFSAIFTRETSFVIFLFAFLHTKPLLKICFTLKGKNLSKRSRFIPFRIDPFPEGGKNSFDKSCLPWKFYPFPLTLILHILKLNSAIDVSKIYRSYGK